MLNEKEEKILKLIVAEMQAKVELNNINQAMGVSIRAEFDVIDQRIRAETRPIFEPLQVKVKAAQEVLKKELDV